MNADRYDLLRIQYGHISAIVWRGALIYLLIVQPAQPFYRT